jgi:hypothetical protein
MLGRRFFLFWLVVHHVSSFVDSLDRCRFGQVACSFIAATILRPISAVPNRNAAAGKGSSRTFVVKG